MSLLPVAIGDHVRYLVMSLLHGDKAKMELRLSGTTGSKNFRVQNSAEKIMDLNGSIECEKYISSKNDTTVIAFQCECILSEQQNMSPGNLDQVISHHTKYSN